MGFLVQATAVLIPCHPDVLHAAAAVVRVAKARNVDITADCGLQTIDCLYGASEFKGRVIT
jgi:hypothetical protein